MRIFHQSTPASTMSLRSTLRQTFCSRANFTEPQGSVDPGEQSMQMVLVHPLRQSAPWCFRSWFHFCWPGSGRSLQGCCLMWFRWGKARKQKMKWFSCHFLSFPARDEELKQVQREDRGKVGPGSAVLRSVRGETWEIKKKIPQPKLIWISKLVSP